MLLIPLVLSLLILVLSAILGRVVARIAAKVKHKNIITVFVSLVFFAAYYYLSARTNSFLQAILLDPEAVGSRLRAVFYTLYHMGMTAQGRVRSMLVFTALAAASGITYLILSRSFLTLAAGSRGAAQIVHTKRGGYWYHKLHIYLYPFYYINDTLTTMGAMEFKKKHARTRNAPGRTISGSARPAAAAATWRPCTMRTSQTPSRPVPSSVPAATRQKFCLRRSQSRTAADALDARPAAPFDSDMIQLRPGVPLFEGRPALSRSKQPSGLSFLRRRDCGEIARPRRRGGWGRVQLFSDDAQGVPGA